MTTEQRTAKIIACIASRGWWMAGIYEDEAKALCAEGKIKLETRRTAVGGTNFVWVAA